MHWRSRVDLEMATNWRQPKVQPVDPEEPISGKGSSSLSKAFGRLRLVFLLASRGVLTVVVVVVVAVSAAKWLLWLS